jgi:hypothetical protein
MRRPDSAIEQPVWWGEWTVRGGERTTVHDIVASRQRAAVSGQTVRHPDSPVRGGKRQQCSKETACGERVARADERTDCVLNG